MWGFLIDFDDFSRSALPGGVGEYREYMRRSMSFIGARNQRIATVSSELRN